MQIARLCMEKDYIWGYATATLDEAVILRKKGIEKPILVLGTVFPDQRAAMIEHEVRMTLYTEEMAAEVSDLAARMGKDVHIHIKLDTGMSRLGFRSVKRALTLLNESARCLIFRWKACLPILQRRTKKIKALQKSS